MIINSNIKINNLPQNNLTKEVKPDQPKFEHAQQKEVASKAASEGLKSYSLQNTVSFGKRIENHRSWGANVKSTNPDGSQDVSFKLWAPNAAKVLVEVRDINNPVRLNDEQFKKEGLQDKWAGEWHLNSDSNDGKSTFIELKKVRHGVFQGKSNIPYKNGMYRYILQDENGNTIAATKDPVSKAQQHIFSWSQIYDQKDFKWSDDEWMKGNNSARVSDLARKSEEQLNSVGLSAKTKDGETLCKPSNLIVKQMNIPTATKEGTITAMKAEIDRIAKDGIYNAILLMPVEGTYDYNWGYDGVDKYAVSRAVADEEGKADATKRNDELKELINYAHSKNINVGMDWVPSHIFKSGPATAEQREQGMTNSDKTSGNFLDQVAPYELPGKWGGNRFNLEDENPEIRNNVRDYLVNMPMNWVDNYHIDFLRADQTPEMCSNYAMKQVAQEIRYHFPHTVLHWEDHRTQDGLTRDLTEKELPYNDIEKHLTTIRKTEKNKTSLENIGGNEHWDFAFSHAIESLLLDKEVMGYHPSMSTLAANIKDIGGTKYIMSHDEIGNDSGARLITKIVHKNLNVFNNLKDIEGESGAEKHIRSLNLIQDLFKEYQFNNENWKESFKELSNKYGLQHLIREDFENCFEMAKSKQKAAMGLLFMVPGSKMIFQGDAYGEINPFRFVRKQAADEKDIEAQKGYNFDEAFQQSKVQPEDHIVNGIFNITKAMSDLVKRNDALQDVPDVNNLDAMTPMVDEENKVITIKRFNNAGNEVIAIINFGNRPLQDYNVNNASAIFGNSNWTETINSDSTIFDGRGIYTNKEKGIFNADNGVKISIPANGITVFEKTNNEGKLYNGTPLFQ